MNGRKIGGYKVVRLLGKGGMSEVYEVEDIQLGGRFALKLFTFDKEIPEVRERFLVEGRLLAKLHHPRIVRVGNIGVDETSGAPYFVMELVADANAVTKSLAEVRPGSVDEETVGRWYDDLREGLAYIHANGVVHRDLKLENVLIGPDGHVVLTDFGISKVFGTKGPEKSVVAAVDTLVKVRDGKCLVMGSVGYLAPELEMGVAASPQSDYYALGVIVYRLLTGTWCDARTDIRGTLEGYDSVWAEILTKLLHANPKARECLSFAVEKAKAIERREMELEASCFLLREQSRRAIGWSVGFGVLACGMAIFCAALWMRQPALPDFDSLFSIPSEAAEESADAMPSKAQFQTALYDAMVLTHERFADLKSGRVTVDKLRDDLKRWHRRARESDYELFSELTGDYSGGNEYEALAILLQRAVEKLQ